MHVYKEKSNWRLQCTRAKITLTGDFNENADWGLVSTHTKKTLTGDFNAPTPRKR